MIPEKSGLDTIHTKLGDGSSFPQKGDTVVVHYVGTLDDGKVFDSSRARNKPFKTEIGVGKVIKGWDEGIPTMSLGGQATFKLKPQWAYGKDGFPPLIPKNATLEFEVELLEIIRKK